MHFPRLHRTFLDPSFMRFFDVSSQFRDEHRAQRCDKILLPDEHAFESPS